MKLRSDYSHKLHDILARRVRNRGAAAVSLRIDAAIWNGNINLAAGDTADEHQGVPLFLSYSCTKTFIAALILHLCEQGHFTLETTIARWFPLIPGSPAMSIRHLLNHTSGLPDYGGLPEYHHAVKLSPSHPWNNGEFLEHTLAQGRIFEPGQGWRYSNIGYMLLRQIAEQETGKSFAQLLASCIFQPLGLRHMFVPETVADLSRLQPGFSVLVTESSAMDVRTVYHPGWVSHGVVASSPRDLVEFYHRLFTGNLLPPDALSAMMNLVTVPGAPAHYGHACYGLGVMADTASRFGIIMGHNGGGPGYEASVFHVPDLHGQPVTACAMCAAEEQGLAELLVFDVMGALEQS